MSLLTDERNRLNTKLQVDDRLFSCGSCMCGRLIPISGLDHLEAKRALSSIVIENSPPKVPRTGVRRLVTAALVLRSLATGPGDAV